jgi:hypothetical protein
MLNLFCRKLDGYKYGGAFKFGQPLLLVRDPEFVKCVLVKDYNSFHDNDIERVLMWIHCLVGIPSFWLARGKHKLHIEIYTLFYDWW